MKGQSLKNKAIFMQPDDRFSQARSHIMVHISFMVTNFKDL